MTLICPPFTVYILESKNVVDYMDCRRKDQSPCWARRETAEVIVQVRVELLNWEAGTRRVLERVANVQR